jgi:hypothetical protein
MDILNFLIYWSSRVYELFGTLYTRVRDAALYAFQWAVQEARNALNAAIQWSSDQIGGILQTAWSWVIDRYNKAVDFARAVQTYVLGLLGVAYEHFNSLVYSARDFASGIVHAVYDWVSSEFRAIIEFINTAVYNARTEAFGLFESVIGFIDARIQDAFGDLITLKNTLFSSGESGISRLILFLSNPLGFIMAYVWDKFQDLLCFGLAYGLGTIEKDLPDLPDWNTH